MAFNSQRFPAPSKKPVAYSDEDEEHFDQYTDRKHPMKTVYKGKSITKEENHADQYDCKRQQVKQSGGVNKNAKGNVKEENHADQYEGKRQQVKQSGGVNKNAKGNVKEENYADQYEGKRQQVKQSGGVHKNAKSIVKDEDLTKSQINMVLERGTQEDIRNLTCSIEKLCRVLSTRNTI